jgi:hypothetical protein
MLKFSVISLFGKSKNVAIRLRRTARLFDVAEGRKCLKYIIDNCELVLKLSNPINTTLMPVVRNFRKDEEYFEENHISETNSQYPPFDHTDQSNTLDDDLREETIKVAKSKKLFSFSIWYRWLSYLR